MLLQSKTVYIRSRRRAMSQSGHPALTCLPNGNILGNSFGPAAMLQQFELEIHRHDNKNVSLVFATFKGSNGNYLSATPDFGIISCASSSIGDNEKWFLKKCGPDGDDACCVSIMSYHGKYLTNDNRFDCGKIVRANRDDVGMWTKWMIVDDSHAFTTYSAGMYLRKVGAVVTTLFFPVVLGAVFIVMNQRKIAYGGSDKTFSVLSVDDTSTNQTDAGLIWTPLKLHTSEAAHNVSEASKDAAHSISVASSTVAASISGASSRALHECGGALKSPNDNNTEGERKSLLYEMEALNLDSQDEQSDMHSERFSNSDDDEGEELVKWDGTI